MDPPTSPSKLAVSNLLKLRGRDPGASPQQQQQQQQQHLSQHSLSQSGLPESAGNAAEHGALPVFQQRQRGSSIASSSSGSSVDSPSDTAAKKKKSSLFSFGKKTRKNSSSDHVHVDDNQALGSADTISGSSGGSTPSLSVTQSPAPKGGSPAIPRQNSLFALLSPDGAAAAGNNSGNPPARTGRQNSIFSAQGLKGFVSKKKQKDDEPAPIQLDLSDFSFDPNYVPTDVVAANAQPRQSAVSQNNVTDDHPKGSHWAPPSDWYVSDGTSAAAASTPLVVPVPQMLLSAASSSSTTATTSTIPPNSKQTSVAEADLGTLIGTANALYGIRVFGPTQFTSLNFKLSATTQDVLSKAVNKFFFGQQQQASNFNLCIVQNGVERVLQPNEYPLLIQKELFEQMGYVGGEDRIDSIGREDNTYLCRFLVRDATIRAELPPDVITPNDAHSTTVVDLFQTNITTIPIALYRYAGYITWLDLSKNPNVQDMPADFARVLTSLRYLSFRGNNLSRVPRCIQHLERLKELDLSNNRIRQLDSTLGISEYQAGVLKKLNLSNNQLEDIPDDLVKEIASGLKKLELCNNNFVTFPTAIFNHARELKYLDLNFCRINDTLPSRIRKLKNLHVFRAAGNSVYGDIPATIVDCFELREIDLRRNRLEGGLEHLLQCPRIENIYCENNHFAPDASRLQDAIAARQRAGQPVAGAAGLKRLRLGFQSPLVTEKQPAPALPLLFLYPLQFAQMLAALQSLDLGFSNIEELDEGFFDPLTELRILKLSGNFLKRLPRLVVVNQNQNQNQNHNKRAAGGLVSLRVLDLANNMLEQVPGDIGELFQLEILEVQENQIKELPAALWTLGKLKEINASSNNIDSWPAPLPAGGGEDASNNLPVARVGDAKSKFDSNDMLVTSAALPPLSYSLKALFLADNRLTDAAILAVLQYFPLLSVLNIAFNDVGDITAWLVQVPNAKPAAAVSPDGVLPAITVNEGTSSLAPPPAISARKTSVVSATSSSSSATATSSAPQPSPPSPLPASLAWFANLSELYLGGNSINTLPAEIDRIKKLRYLFLNGNKMATIPAELSRLGKLIGLDVSAQFGGRGEGTGLRYNVHNWPYDWNWNWNLELQYLNLSVNKRLEIKPPQLSSALTTSSQQQLQQQQQQQGQQQGQHSGQGHAQTPSYSHHHGGHGGTGPKTFSKSARDVVLATTPLQTTTEEDRKKLTDFSALSKISLLGLMDVTCLVALPDEMYDRRTRTTGSEVPMLGVPAGTLKYSIADALGRPTEDTSFFGIWDLVTPKFRNADNESLFGVFDGRGSVLGAKFAKFCHDNFGYYLANELKKHEFEKDRRVRKIDQYVGDTQLMRGILRRTFLALNKELGSVHFASLKEDAYRARKAAATARDGASIATTGGGTFLRARRSTNAATTPSNNNNNNNLDGSYSDSGDDLAGSATTGLADAASSSYYAMCGCSATVVYLVGLPPKPGSQKKNCVMFVANVGDDIAVLSRSGGVADVLSKSHSLRMSDAPKEAMSSEIERIRRAGGVVNAEGLINGSIDTSRAMGYFDCLGSVIPDPHFRRVDLELEDDEVRVVLPTAKELADMPNKGDALDALDDRSDEFLVLANSAVWQSISSGGSYDDAGQIMVDIARSSLGLTRLPGDATLQKSPENQLALIKNHGRLHKGHGTGWSLAAMKIRDVALSLGSYGGPRKTAASGAGGYMVMIMGFSDLARKLALWQLRRGSAESLGGDEKAPALSSMRERSNTVQRNAAALAPKLPAAEALLVREIEPPQERLALVFTDIKNSTVLWEGYAKPMRESLKLHHAHMRKLLRASGGYEVKTEGDAFMVAFPTAPAALEWCLRVQLDMLALDWAPEMLQSRDAGEIFWRPLGGNASARKRTSITAATGDATPFSSSGAAANSSTIITGPTLSQSQQPKPDGGSDSVKVDGHVYYGTKLDVSKRRKDDTVVFRGLTIRMGIHFGTPLCEPDPTTQRMDYYGPMVNRSARVSGTAQGGQIVMSLDVLKEVRNLINRKFQKSPADDKIVNFERIRSGDDVSELIPEIAQPESEIMDPELLVLRRIKSYGFATHFIGETKLKGLETPEVLYAVYPRKLALRHNYFTLLQAGKLREIDQESEHAAAEQLH